MDAIGPFSFNRISGMPQRMQGQWALSARAGVNGVAMKWMGISAEPFTLQTQDFAASFTAAEGLYRAYQFLTLAGPQFIMRGNFLEPNQMFQVLRVDPLRIEAIVAGYKPNDANVYRGICECQWLLQPIDTTIQPP